MTDQQKLGDDRLDTPSPEGPWVIVDWAGNVLWRRDQFRFGIRSHYASMAVEFESFEDAEEYLSEKLDDSYETDRGEFYVVLKSGELE